MNYMGNVASISWLAAVAADAAAVVDELIHARYWRMCANVRIY